MATGLFTSNHDWSNEFTAHLTADITASSTDIFLDTIPTPSEGCLVIDPDTPGSYEIILYTSKTGTKVTVPSVANGRGYDGSTAGSHLSGTKVIMAPIADDLRYIRTVATTTPQGWSVVANTPNTVTALGNRSYSMVFNSVDLTSTLSAGMRLKTTRTVAAPTQCTSLNGTTQYYSKTSPAGMTFTNNFVASAWVKLSSYAATEMQVITRYNGTSGWKFRVEATGQVTMVGHNGGAANFSQVTSYQSIPLNKWVHIAAQLDMATFTASTTTSYVMIDGVDVPASVSRGGTNPTALIQAGNLEVGSTNAGIQPFPGKIAQVAIYGAKVTEATILASINQGLAGTETSLISAYSFNNSINDLNANANNLTANGSAVATNADSPFGGQADGTISSTLDYAIVTKTAFSTNTTLTVQVPEGCTIPTSGGVAAVSYSTQKVPYLFPAQRGKWCVETWCLSDISTSISALNQWFSTLLQTNIPIGEWRIGYEGTFNHVQAASSTIYGNVLLAPATPTNAVRNQELVGGYGSGASGTSIYQPINRTGNISLAASTAYILYAEVQVNSGATTVHILGTNGAAVIRAELAHL